MDSIYPRIQVDRSLLYSQEQILKERYIDELEKKSISYRILFILNWFKRRFRV